MIPAPEQIRPVPEESFRIGVFQDHIDQSRWHYHNEYELSFITEGSGKRIVGDSTGEFNPGDLVFIGPRIPHVWISDSPYRSIHSGRTLEMVYLLFNEAMLPYGLLTLPEFTAVRDSLRLAERGLRIEGHTLNTVSAMMLQMPYLSGMKRFACFLEILDAIGKGTTYTILTSVTYRVHTGWKQDPRISAIHEYLMRHYHDPVSLDKLAGAVHMAPGSVCRLFKSRTGLTVFEYLNKLKIELSCQMLSDTSLGIEEISFKCGFNNLSYFNRQFNRLTGHTPTSYRKLVQINP